MKNSQYRKLLASIDALEDVVTNADDEVVVDELIEQAPEELEVENIDDASELEEAIKAAEEMIGDNEELEDEEDNVDEDIAIAEDVLAPIADDDDELVLPDDDGDIVSSEEVQEVLDACDELEQQFDADAFTASETQPGVEDEIGDEANGGDSSVSNLADAEIDTKTNAEVFPTESEYVARVTARLDKIATALERKGLKRMAFRVDKLSDELENSIK